MVSMASWGTMTAMLSTGARIAGERQAGWNRQLRISPLSAFSYLRAKVAIAYLMALLSLIDHVRVRARSSASSLPARTGWR